MKKKNHGVLAAFRGVFDAFLTETLPAPRRARCRKIRELLLAGFDPRWVGDNQKFDFSFSAPGAGGFRFSVSDYGEKARFEKKLLRVFSLPGAAYDRSRLAAVLAVTRPTNARHQTTFGLEWKAADRAPRLKVYFEELRDGYPRRARVQLLENICAAAGLQAPVAAPEDDIAAIGLDFLPGGGTMLKAYLYSDRAGLGRPETPAHGAFAAALSREDRAFFYKTRRYDAGGALVSRKLYKVYEVRQIADFAPALAEIYKALVKTGAGGEIRRLERYRALAAINGSMWYPVLCAMDVKARGETRIDSYFSLR
jgi:hypothetical protein